MRFRRMINAIFSPCLINNLLDLFRVRVLALCCLSPCVLSPRCFSYFLSRLGGFPGFLGCLALIVGPGFKVRLGCDRTKHARWRMLQQMQVFLPYLNGRQFVLPPTNKGCPWTTSRQVCRRTGCTASGSRWFERHCFSAWLMRKYP